MPKAKTKKSIAKRVKVTATGKFMTRRRVVQHLVERASRRAVAEAGKFKTVSKTLKRGLKRLLPYAK